MTLADWTRSDNPDDVEIGAQVWSNTHQDSLGWVGGVVIRIDPIARTCEVLPNVGKQGPRPHTLALDELHPESTRLDTRSAGITAIQLWAWLATLTTKKSRDDGHATRWAQVAVQLQTLQDGGLLLPGREAAYQATRQQRLDR